MYAAYVGLMDSRTEVWSKVIRNRCVRYDFDASNVFDGAYIKLVIILPRFTSTFFACVIAQYCQKSVERSSVEGRCVVYTSHESVSSWLRGQVPASQPYLGHLQWLVHSCGTGCGVQISWEVGAVDVTYIAVA